MLACSTGIGAKMCKPVESIQNVWRPASVC